MAQITSAIAAKQLRKLNDQRDALLAMEKKSRTFTAAIQEDVESVRPAYDFQATQDALVEIEEKIRNLKHTLNCFNALSVHVDEDDKRVIQRSEITTFEIPNRGMTVINESGLYSLILSSHLPGARQFKRWVTSEVLPSIRKHGIYATPITIDRILNDPDLGIRLFTQLKEEREKRAALETTVAVQTQQIAEMHPKATYYDTVLQCKDLVTITRIAKDFRLSAQALNRILAERKVQYKQGDMWVLYQRYAEKGYTQSKTYTYGTENEHAKMHTLWTQAGRLFIYDLLKADGILPTVEME